MFTSDDLLATRLSCDDLLSTRLGRSWSLEPLVATLSFAAFMRLFRLYEEKRPTSVFRPPFLFSTRAFGSLFVYWLGVAMWVCIVPRPVGAASGCPHSFGDYFHLAAEVAAGLISYDFLFFFVHLLMHHSARFGSWTNHAQHHKFTHDESSYRTVNHSLVDGTMQVLVNILVQRHTPWGAPKTKLARLLHNVLIIELLVESHSSSRHPRIARRLFTGVDGHVRHHRHGGPPYEAFFGYLDWAWARWEQWYVKRDI